MWSQQLAASGDNGHFGFRQFHLRTHRGQYRFVDHWRGVIGGEYSVALAQIVANWSVRNYTNLDLLLCICICTILA